MKVRFSSSKEQDPTRDGGLRVLYAPGKRVAFRLRWYLILLLVASPFLWFVGKLAMGVFLVEAPARILQPTVEIRALEGGQVRALAVEPGDRVKTGTVLVTLDSPELRARSAALAAGLTEAPRSAAAPEQTQRQALQRQLERSRERVRALEPLVAAGTATRGELNAARDQLDQRQAELAGFERSLAPNPVLGADALRQQQELNVIRQRLDLLQVQAPESGQVRDIEVSTGENVGPGQLLLRLARDQAPEIHVFLNTRRIDLAQPGQTLRMKLPDGTWLDARVSEVPGSVSRLPPDLRSPFGSNELGLLVKVTTTQPLPPEWQIDNVPVTARFPNVLQQWLADRQD